MRARVNQANRSPRRLLALILAIVAGTELIVMLILPGVVADSAPWWAQAFADTALLTLFAGITLCFAVARPLRRAAADSTQIAERVVSDSFDAIITASKTGRIITFNPAAERTFGYEASDVVGKDVGILMPAPHRDQHDDRLDRYLRTGAPRVIGTRREAIGRRADGEEFPLEFSILEMRLGGNRIFAAVIRDITDRKRTEEELRARAQTIAAANSELERQKTDLEGQRAALQTTNSELAQARVAADASNNAKSAFLANMSHEIRTPMTAILGFAELIEDQYDPAEVPAGRLDAVRTIRRNGEHLLRLINDILDMSKIEAGRMTVDRVPCSPMECINDVLTLMRVRATAKKLSLQAEFIGAFPATVKTDPTRLRQILINLIGNAIKFTSDGGIRLVVRCVNEQPGSMLQFDVADTGVGMTGDQAKSLFQPFSQADASTSRMFGGTGLGLCISRQLARLLGGDIEIVESEMGFGTRFRATIATDTVDEAKMLDTTTAMLDFAAIPPRQKPGRCKSLFKRSGLECRILLAEDGEDNQRLISTVLQLAGADVAVVENGQEAVDTALEATRAGSPYDVILMDMQMPVLDGYRATSTLREHGYDLPIIALTAHTMTGDRDKCLNAGCDDYAAKPINRKELIAAINAQIASAAEPL